MERKLVQGNECTALNVGYYDIHVTMSTNSQINHDKM